MCRIANAFVVKSWDHVEPFKAAMKLQFDLQLVGCHLIWRCFFFLNLLNFFTLISFQLKTDMNILGDMEVSKLSGNVYSGSELIL